MEQVTGPLMNMVFPVSPSEERTFTRYSTALGEACSGHGRAMASAMSTAQVARDMDVLRRAVGDQRLSFLGFSYGTYLGQVYANLFPDRVRAIAIDGVVDARAWVGTPQTADVPVSVRMNVAPATSAALDSALAACAQAGAERCPLEDPRAAFARVTDRLLASPLQIDDPDNGPWLLRYQDFLNGVLFALYTEGGPEEVVQMTAMAEAMQSPTLAASERRASALAFRKATERATGRALAKGVATPYDNTVEQVPIIMCSDSRNPKRASTWASLADSEDARAPYFGRYWLWGSVHCAGQSWHAFDEDAYAGPFDKVTSAPILVVGNRHDPATSYQAAVDVARLIPRGRLLSSTNWGHTAYGVSACATTHVDRYLVNGALPAAGTWCTDGREPFRD